MMIKSVQENLISLRNFLSKQNVFNFEILLILSSGADRYLIYSQGMLLFFGSFYPLHQTDGMENACLFIDKERLNGFAEIASLELFLNIFDLTIDDGSEVIYISSNSNESYQVILQNSLEQDFLDKFDVKNEINLRYAGLTAQLNDVNAGQYMFASLKNTTYQSSGTGEIFYSVEGRKIVLLAVHQSWGNSL